jgi:hypothetical protein
MNVRGLMVWCVLVSALAVSAAAQPYSEAQFKGMKWRDIGPYRGGRVLAVTGIPGSPSPTTLAVSREAFGAPPMAA